MPSHSVIKHVNSAGLIVQIKEIKVAVFNQYNTTAIIKEDLRTKSGQVIVIDDNIAMAVTNMTVCSDIKKQQSNSEIYMRSNFYRI